MIQHQTLIGCVVFIKEPFKVNKLIIRVHVQVFFKRRLIDANAFDQHLNSRVCDGAVVTRRFDVNVIHDRLSTHAWPVRPVSGL